MREDAEVADAHEARGGSRCSRNCRRNSSAIRLIRRFLFLCAESRQRKVTRPSVSDRSRWLEMATRWV